jgi:hypothetical protein
MRSPEVSDSPPRAAAPPHFRRTIGVLVGSAVALLIGAVALVSGVLPLIGPAGAADRAAAVPNLLTGLAALAGGAGYWAGKRWGVYVYALSVLGHFLVHAAFFVSSLGSGRGTPFTALTLAFVPVVALLVLISMEVQRRQGRLS